MGLFDGLRNAKTSDKGVWLKEGVYQVRVKRALYKKTRSKGDAFILEITVETQKKEDFSLHKWGLIIQELPHPHLQLVPPPV